MFGQRGSRQEGTLLKTRQFGSPELMNEKILGLFTFIVDCYCIQLYSMLMRYLNRLLNLMQLDRQDSLLLCTMGQLNSLFLCHCYVSFTTELRGTVKLKV